MEEKQLDFNAPFLSVRRFTPSVNSNREDSKKAEKPLFRRQPPAYRSEIQSGPVRNAGSIPFLWEQTPGRPKDGGGEPIEDLEMPPSAPKLPPGRSLNVKQLQQQQLQQKQQQLQKQQPQVSLTNPIEGTKVGPPIKIKSQNNNLKGGITLESSKENTKEEGKHNSAKDNYDEFSDAVDTLSCSESFRMTCSISGLSALDLHDSNPSRSLSLDPEARDFMMDRFLPAAKAMASETPQYALRKPAAPREAVRPANRDGENRKPLPLLSWSLVAPPKVPDANGEESEGDYEDYDDTQNMTQKACGMLPRFFLKNSLCLLNPIPGMKGHGRMLLPPASHKLSVRSKATSGHASISESDDEHSWEAVYKYKLAQGLQSPGSHEIASKAVSETYELTYWSESQTPDGSSPYRQSTDDVTSPNQIEAQQSSLQKETGFLGLPKQGKAMRADRFKLHGKTHLTGLLNSHSDSPRGSDSSSPTIEKTLYVDSIQALETPKSISSLSASELKASTCKGTDITDESDRLEKVSNVEDQYKMVQEAIVQSDISLNFDRIPSCSDTSILGAQPNKLEMTQQSDNLKCSKKEDYGDSFFSTVQSLLPPPLPKSPSESWLWRTLPSIPSRTPSSGSYIGIHTRQKRQALKSSSADPKWENMVKTSNTHHGNSRFSEELKKPPSQQSET